MRGFLLHTFVNNIHIKTQLVINVLRQWFTIECKLNFYGIKQILVVHHRSQLFVYILFIKCR